MKHLFLASFILVLFNSVIKGQPNNPCPITANTVDLPDCMRKYFLNGILIDGNGNVCNSNKPVMPARMTLATLFQRAEAIMNSGTCQGEMGGGPPPQGRRRKRQPMMSCGTGNGVGNCDTTGSRLQNIYGEKMFNNGLLIVTNGIPNHCYQDGVDMVIPNGVCEHYRMLWVPLNPLKTNVFKNHNMGPVGIARSGAFFFNHLSAEQTCNVAAITEKQTFDTCDGHPNPTCQYHYHKAPNCIKGFATCGLVGYSNDAFPIYGKCSIILNGQVVPMKSCYRKIDGTNGCDRTHYVFDRTVVGCNLDEANGYSFPTATMSSGTMTFKAGSYGYFFTPEYPFSMPGYYGEKNQARWCVINI